MRAELLRVTVNDGAFLLHITSKEMYQRKKEKYFLLTIFNYLGFVFEKSAKECAKK